MQRFLMVLILCSYHIFCQYYDTYTLRQYFSFERIFQNFEATVLLHIGEPYHYDICVYSLDAALSNGTNFMFLSYFPPMLLPIFCMYLDYYYSNTSMNLPKFVKSFSIFNWYWTFQLCEKNELYVLWTSLNNTRW